MTPGARVQAAIEVLDQIIEGTPAEKALTVWSRKSRFAGSKDRAAVRDHVFGVLRRRNSASAIGGAFTGRGLMLGALRLDGRALAEIFTGAPYAPAPLTSDEETVSDGPLPLDIPEWTEPLFKVALEDGFDGTVEAMRERAPVYLRVNLRKARKDKVRAHLEAEGIETRATTLSNTALEVVSGARRIRQSSLYREGHIELQDVSSQIMVEALPLKSGAKVLDYCAGGGGKSLAMAGLVEAQFFAHDAFANRMADLPARAKRAGVKIRLVDDPSRMAPYDLVLCDVPCSGSGTWRRTPDAKWGFTRETLDNLCATQESILGEAQHLVGKDGVLVYSTCSFFIEENTSQVQAFCQRNPNWEVELHRQLGLGETGDGFFFAVLRRK